MKPNQVVQSGVVAMILALAVSSFAKTSNDDFNSMIQENQATQNELSEKLQKQLKPAKLTKEEQHPDFHKFGQDQLGHDGSENVAVDTSGSDSAPVNKKTVARRQAETDKKNFKRLSEEMKDLK
jgi:hypothetical protein